MSVVLRLYFGLHKVPIKVVKNSKQKMQDVGNGHALKKGMMPDLRTIDHLPIAFDAKK